MGWESEAIPFCDRENLPRDATEQVGSNFVLVGSVPCRLSSEVHVDE
jgi:hypothetical protein